MAENVKVIVRCRPMNKKEHDLNCQCIVKTKSCTVELWDPNEASSTALPKQFTFDSTYGQDSHTETIYNEICYPIVESALEGYNATVFVYGQTGCGKSHTMEGTKPEKGLISRAFEHIFEAIAVTSGIKYLAMISYLEIYNETIRDLLDTKTPPTTLNLKEHPTEGVSVAGLSTHAVHNAAECEHYLNLGAKNRIIGATLMNQNSSRSHSIFTISIEQIAHNNNANEAIRKGKLNLVDLAGSERQTKTGATGDRLKEATKINLSLSALGNVISALVDGKAKHIPYRDSKLTRLLQDSLGGNTRTLMIACVSPASRDYVETLSTLRYANRAKNIHNKPIVNEDPKDAILRQYQDEIERLKAMLEAKETIEKKNDDRNEVAVMETTKTDEILQRIETLKKAMIGGEKADDRELSDRRKRKKMAAERRASVIAHLLAKIDMNEDRELLQNEYKDISHELKLTGELLRKYKNRVRLLEKEIKDIQGEFEAEREDYLESIRKQERNVKLLAQMADKMAAGLKKECNYSDLEGVKREAVWMEDGQRYKLPEMVTSRTRLPPPGRFLDTQTAPARLSTEDELFLEKKLENSDKDDLSVSYFQPTTKRAAELLSQSSKLSPDMVFKTWRDFALRNKPKTTENTSTSSFKPEVVRKEGLSGSFGHLDWTLATSDRKPIRLDALPNIDKQKRKRAMEFS